MNSASPSWSCGPGSGFSMAASTFPGDEAGSVPMSASSTSDRSRSHLPLASALSSSHAVTIAHSVSVDGSRVPFSAA
ncbi:hypothetical protein [Streptomyces sp. LN549]|uniref:hypothetical protein n=1 Tax=Streptomyces sp. LN549 TaxID=3112979 RepID=UPI003718A6DB